MEPNNINITVNGDLNIHHNSPFGCAETIGEPLMKYAEGTLGSTEDNNREHSFSTSSKLTNFTAWVCIPDEDYESIANLSFENVRKIWNEGFTEFLDIGIDKKTAIKLRDWLNELELG